jgi:LPPG:FO 2-phospho-L-lactate transferase
VLGPGELTVVANTGDDVEVYGVHVSPDPDLVTYWLADVIDERGYGIRGDTWEVMGAFERAGRPAWFRLGDRDLAMCLIRTELLHAGRRLTDAHAAVVEAVGVAAQVLPMSDEPVRAQISARGRAMPFQEYMILERAAAPVEGVELLGIADARPTADVLAALDDADAIVIGPSNPVISIGPILAVPGLRDALRAAPGARVAVSPIVGGRALKGPADRMLAGLGYDVSSLGVARLYRDLLDGFVLDVTDAALAPEVTALGPRALVTQTIMGDADDRRRLAAEVLAFAHELRRERERTGV